MISMMASPIGTSETIATVGALGTQSFMGILSVWSIGLSRLFKLGRMKVLPPVVCT
ncbi:hypothetical protein HOE425_331298 [Hoeflea sp. EC-HK425]|nr:hypothetical protein HOE425_331298 [Hoeflea sp. EC-HK425]